MKRLRLILFLVGIIIATKIAAAQTVSTLMGARTMGLGYSSAALSDEWSLQNNPAGLAWLKGSWIATSAQRLPSLVGADRIASNVGIAGRVGGLSAGAFKFGDDVYSEQNASIAYANKLGLASLGGRIDLIQYRAEGIEPVVALGVTFGTRARITDQFVVGAYASNINRPHFPDGRALPIRMAAGFSWQPTKQLMLCGELEKVADHEPTIKSGLELTPLKKFKLRTGLNLFPYAFYGGFGVSAWKVNIDYGISFSYALSYSHNLTLALSGLQTNK